MNTSSRFFPLAVAFFFATGCQITNPKPTGEFDAGRAEYRPSRPQRACTIDSDCVAVETDCRDTCPGGGAINKTFVPDYLRERKKSCATLGAPKLRRSGGRPGVCVAAPVKCEAGMCTWMYEGPDPSTL